MRIAALGLAVVLAAGCDNGKPHHDPPPGLGGIIVDNHSPDVIHFYVNGTFQVDVDSFDWEAVDVPPGIVRVVLDQKGGSRNYRDDLDVLDGQNTILDVQSDAGPDRYDVRIRFD